MVIVEILIFCRLENLPILPLQNRRLAQREDVGVHDYQAWSLFIHIVSAVNITESNV